MVVSPNSDAYGATTKKTTFSEFNFVFTDGVTTKIPDADDPVVSTGSAPTPLPPSGKTYAATRLHTHDTLTNYRNKDTWYENFGTGAVAMMQDGADGIMFKVDTSKASVDTNNMLKMTFALQLNHHRADGTYQSTYLVATPKQAAQFHNYAKTSSDDAIEAVHTSQSDFV
jgi:hypothetical protein